MRKISLLMLFIPYVFFAQGYTSYFTGNPTNITTNPEFGVCLMGGATEHDNAMIWLLQKANGGDVVVLRSTGSNGYNDYLYSQLGVSVNSVETLVITSVAGATNPYVLNKVANAEMIWFAGGDQYNYVSYFKDNALEDLISQHVTTKHAPIGGTSAGMAILGGKYFSAQNGTVTSAQAISNPYASNVTLGGYTGTPTNSFLNVPFLGSVITDTHYDNPDRRGRHATFMARLKLLTTIYGIACNEYVAVCIGTDGIAHVYGDYPNYQEFAYFIQPNCNIANTIENCVAGQPLTWNFGGQALKVYKVPGTMNGTNYFDVNNWENGVGAGGTWENWSVNNGVFTSVAGSAPNCTLGNEAFSSDTINTIPNPFSDFLLIENAENTTVELFDSLGKKLFFETNFTSNTIDTSNLSSGLYFLKVTKDGITLTKKVIKQ
jgi:cyanophycinase-like exopeptidase